MLLLQEGQEKSKETVNASGQLEKKVTRKGINPAVANEELEKLSTAQDVAISKMLRFRVRYFTDGAVIGSRDFVNGFFEAARQKLSAKRKDGARKMRGAGAPASESLWSFRDLRTNI